LAGAREIGRVRALRIALCHRQQGADSGRCRKVYGSGSGIPRAILCSIAEEDFRDLMRSDARMIGQDDDRALQRDLWDAGDGGLFSTLDDLFLWDRALNIERLDRSLNLRYRRNRRCASRQPERLSGAILFVSLTLGSLAARAADRTRTGHDGGACTLRPLAARMLATCRLAAPPIAV
jgi:hypothetical protein